MRRKKSGVLNVLGFILLTVIAYIILYFAASLFASPRATTTASNIFEGKPILSWIFVIALLLIGASLFYLAFMIRNKEV